MLPLLMLSPEVFVASSAVTPAPIFSFSFSGVIKVLPAGAYLLAIFITDPAAN